MIDNNDVMKTLIFVYIFLLCFNKSLFTNSVQKNISDDKIIKQFLLFFCISLVSRYIFLIKDINKIIINSFITYFIILLLSKCETEMTMIIIGFIVLYFVIDSKIEQKYVKQEQKHDTYTKNTSRNFVIFLFLISMIVGCGMYSNKKYVQYGGSFEMKKFLFL